MAPVPTADHISVREVLATYEAEFDTMARAVENGEFALWVGSGISRNGPNLGDLMERALDFLRVRAIHEATPGIYSLAFGQALRLGNVEPADLTSHFATPLAEWPERDAIIRRLWKNYSRVLDIRIKGELPDYILWEAIDIRAAFAHPEPPAAEHLCIAILILEGAVGTIASANWDGFIEAAIARLSAGAQGVLQVVVDPNQLRDTASRSKLLKFHGCIIYATQNPGAFRRYLTGSQTQITEWPDKQMFEAMRNAVLNVATNKKTLVVGLSIQDSNLQSIFSKAKQVNPWPWPCEPQAPGHIFCEDVITEGQSDVLKIVYGNAYNDNVDAIHASTHLRAWGEQVLLALVLKLIADKLKKLMELALNEAGRATMTAELAANLIGLRDHIADLAIGDRTAFTNAAIASWSRLLSLFRRGVLPANAEAYEVVSNSVPDTLEADHNAQANRLGGLGVALSLLQHGRADGLWELALAAAPEATAGALTARGNWHGAPERPLFLVKSATEAIALQRNGSFANDKAIVVHADDAWHHIAGGRSGTGVRRPRGAPGRIGRVRTTHVSLGSLIEACDDVDALKNRFVAETTL
ncbi:SIR2 family protein [Candidatus Rariloculus sp.]|uniref:SIR2 family protein n=1 Tax=Candidatus Rariloculus sp. TaxID=3101265 RepID=UPI003D0A2D37